MDWSGVKEAPSSSLAAISSHEVVDLRDQCSISHFWMYLKMLFVSQCVPFWASLTSNICGFNCFMCVCSIL